MIHFSVSAPTALVVVKIFSVLYLVFSLFNAVFFLQSVVTRRVEFPEGTNQASIVTLFILLRSVEILTCVGLLKHNRWAWRSAFVFSLGGWVFFAVTFLTTIIDTVLLSQLDPQKSGVNDSLLPVGFLVVLLWAGVNYFLWQVRHVYLFKKST